MWRSVPQMEAARTRTRTSVGPIAGMGMDASSAPRAGRVLRRAFIVVDIKGLPRTPAQLGCGDYSLDASELVAGIAAATLGPSPFGASPSARARIFRAAMWSASPACPHNRQQNPPRLLRFPRSVCPQAGQVWLV